MPKPKSGLAFPYMKNVSTDLFIRNINLNTLFVLSVKDFDEKNQNNGWKNQRRRRNCPPYKCFWLSTSRSLWCRSKSGQSTYLMFFNLSDSLIPRGMRQAKNKYVIRFLEIIISLQTFHWGTARIWAGNSCCHSSSYWFLQEPRHEYRHRWVC